MKRAGTTVDTSGLSAAAPTQTAPEVQPPRAGEPLSDAANEGSDLHYWIGQLCFWGGHAGIQVYQAHSFGRLSSSMLFGYVTAATLAALSTHTLRYTFRKTGWIRHRLSSVVPRLVLASSLGAAAVVAGALYLEGLLFPARAQAYALTTLTQIFLYWLALLFLWASVYYALHLYRWTQRLQVERWKLESAVRTAELRSLRAQLDPHFMFNSLNSIRGMIQESPQKAQELVTQLATTLRYSLHTRRAATAPLESEMRTVKAYLRLEAARLEERLQVRLEVDDDAARTQVPPLIVQTLVENAVRHGIAPRVKGGEITLVARVDAGVLRVRVSSPGRLSGTNAGGGTGLVNARERLRLIYGSEAALSLYESEDDRVVAEVHMPKEPPR